MRKTCVIAFAALVALVGNISAQESDEKQLAEALRVVEKAEPYSHFLAVEKELIPTPSEAYAKARKAYILTNFVEKKEAQNPGKALPDLIRVCREEGYLKEGDAKKKYQDAAWLMGMELLTDRPSFAVDLSGVEVTTGLVFAKNPEIELKLDLFLPKKRSGEPLPVVIAIHGGGWRVHRRAWFNGHAAYFAKHGLAAVSIDYRMLPAIKSLVPAIEDCKAAVRWVRANAKKYGLDPDHIGAVGGSAGAHLSAMLATTAGVEELEGKGGNAEQSSAIQAAVGYATPVFKISKEDAEKSGRWGMTPETIRLVSPYANVDKNSAPLLLIHGTADRTVPIQNSRDIHEKYQKVGARSRLQVLDGKPHVFYTRAEAAQWATEFFKKEFGVE